MKYLLAIVILSGCASLPEGVQMTEDERRACAEHGCSGLDAGGA